MSNGEEVREGTPSPYAYVFDTMIDHVSLDTDNRLTPEARRQRAEMLMYLTGDILMTPREAKQMVSRAITDASDVKISLQHLMPEDVYDF